MPRRDGDEGGVAVLNRPVGDENGPSADMGASTNGTEGATGEAPSGETAAPEPVKRTRVKRDVDQMGPEEVISLNVRVPNALRLKIAETAKEKNTSVPQLVSEMLATAYEFELPKPKRAARVKKYDSPEERKAAQKKAQAHQRMVTKAILRAVEQGTIPGLDVDALVAQIQAEETAKAASAATTEGTETPPATEGAATGGATE